MAGAVPDTNTTVTIINPPQNNKVAAPRITNRQKVFSDIVVLSFRLRNSRERHLCGK